MDPTLKKKYLGHWELYIEILVRNLIVRFEVHLKPLCKCILIVTYKYV